MERKLVKIRLNKKDYLVPLASEEFGQRLMRITNHPLDPNKVLVWRDEMRKPMTALLQGYVRALLREYRLDEMRKPTTALLQEPPSIENLSNRSIVINEAVLAENRIHEKREIADLVYGTLGKMAWAGTSRSTPRSAGTRWEPRSARPCCRT